MRKRKIKIERRKTVLLSERSGGDDFLPNASGKRRGGGGPILMGGRGKKGGKRGLPNLSERKGRGTAFFDPLRGMCPGEPERRKRAGSLLKKKE